MSTTWYITKEYLKRLEINFEEKGRKTFCLLPYGPPETEEIEVFPGENWITLTTRLMKLEGYTAKEKRNVYEHLLKANAKFAEISYGLDKKSFIILRNAIPVIGISYDAFSSIYQAHISGLKFFHSKMKPLVAKE